MDRYRAYGPQDDQSGNVGDYGFDGANYYDRPENLQPGQVQAATNIDFTAGAAETRGGVVCIPELGNAPFGAGYDWVSRSIATTSHIFKAVAFGNGRFVAMDSTGQTNDVYYSDDGIAWTAVATGLGVLWEDVTYGNGLFVAVSGASPTSLVATSTDGITWSTPTLPAHTNAWKAVTYGEGKYVVVAFNGGSSRIMYSTNGTTWTLATGVPTDNYSSICYGNGTFVAVARVDQGQGSTMSSPDGITWTAHNASYTATQWEDVVWGGSVFVAVGTNGGGTNSVMTSPDGDVWTSRTSPDSEWEAITYGNSIFVSVSRTGTSATGKVMVSSDGLTWTAVDAASSTKWYDVAFGSYRFVAVGDVDVVIDGAMTSGYQSGPGSVLASCVYSDPNTPTDTWIALAGASSVGFYAFGRTPRSVDYPGGFTLAEQATLVQANNKLFLFPGDTQTPIYWDGDWSTSFASVPASDLGAGFESIPESNHATYYQNRLWVVNGKDSVAASDVLDFEEYDQIANSFNLNTGAADYVVNTYPFGDNSLVVFKHNSSVLLENVQGSLSDVTATEISRNLGIIGINAVTAVGPDLVYVSDRNISTIRLNLQNKLQNVTEPLSRNIGPLIGRINWQYAYKISLGYWDNRLFVAVPMDDSTVCDTILVYNFITQQWYGEWNFAAEIAMNVQGFVVANYLGQLRLHIITEDGRIFVTDQGQNDISGSTVAEISTSMTTRAYNTNNTAHRQRRMYMDIETNRPEFSVTSYTDGASEYSDLLTDQTYTRSESWKWNDSTYTLTNANDDFNRAFRRDYSTGPNSVQCGTGFQPEMRQSIRLPLITRRQGRLSWLKIENTQGYMLTRSVGFESTPGQRSSLVQV